MWVLQTGEVLAPLLARVLSVSEPWGLPRTENAPLPASGDCWRSQQCVSLVVRPLIEQAGHHGGELLGDGLDDAAPVRRDLLLLKVEPELVHVLHGADRLAGCVQTLEGQELPDQLEGVVDAISGEMTGVSGADAVNLHDIARQMNLKTRERGGGGVRTWKKGRGVMYGIVLVLGLVLPRARSSFLLFASNSGLDMLYGVWSISYVPYRPC